MEREKIKISKDLWDDIVEEWKDCEFESVEEEITSLSRWDANYLTIVKRKSDGKFFKASWSKGLTEYQDYSNAPSELVEVFPKIITKTIYE
jgi:hypothetical protein